MARSVGDLFASLRLDTAKLSGDVNNAVKSLHKIGRQATFLGQDLTKAVTVPITAIGAASIKVGSDFESAFAGVRKTVDATEPEFARLEQGFRDMAKEIPQSASALASIGEAAGQLGIETPKILKFTRVVADLGVATNLEIGEAATSLARFANITQTSQDDFDRMGSTIVALGNNFATTEKEIVEMGLRLAGAGKQVGLTEPQILALAASLSSVGLEAQAGGTAFSRFLVEVEKSIATGSDKLEIFAAVAGKTAGEFARIFKEDAAGATQLFVQGLANAAKEGKSISVVLEALGLDAVRVADALKRSTQNVNGLSDAFELAERAWQENNALSKEAEERYKTFASQILILKNELVDVGITIFQAIRPALMDTVIPLAKQAAAAVGALAEWFGKLPQPVRTATVALAGIAAALGPAIYFFGQLALSAKGIITFLPLVGKAATLMLSPFFAIPATLAAAGASFVSLANDINATWSASTTLAQQVDQSKSVWTRLKSALLGPVGALMDLINALGMAKNFFVIWQEQGIRAAVESLKGLEGQAKATGHSVEFIGPPLSMAGDKTRELGESADAAAPPIIDLDRFMGKAGDTAKKLAQEADRLAESFRDQMKPANSLAKEIQILLDKGFSRSEIVAVWGDRILEAARSQEKNAASAGKMSAELPPLIADLADLAGKADTAAAKAELLAQKFQLMKVLPDLKDQIKGVREFDINLSMLSRTTIDAERKFESMGRELQDTERAIRELSERGFTNQQIMELMGSKIDGAARAARVLGKDLDPATAAIIRQKMAAEENAKAAAQFEQAWIQALGNIYSDFIQWASNTIAAGNTFVARLLDIFLNNLFKPLLSMANAFMSRVAGAIWGLLTGQGFGGFGQIFAGGIGSLLGLGGSAVGAGAAAGGAAAGGAGIGAAAGGTAAAGGAAAGGGMFGSLGAFFTNPWTIGIGAAIGGGLLLHKAFTNTPLEAASKEVFRDFGIKASENMVKGFTQGTLGLSEKMLEPIRKDILSSPKFFQEILLPAAKAAGQVDQLVARFGRLEAFGRVFDLSAEAARAAKGDFEALNAAWSQIFAQSQALQQIMPNWQQVLMGVSTVTSEAGDAAESAGEGLAEMGEAGTSALDKLAAGMSEVRDSIVTGFEVMIERIDKLLEHLGISIDQTINKLRELDAVKTVDQRIAVQSVQPGGGGDHFELNMTVQSRSEDLVRTTRDEVIPEITRALDNNSRGITSTWKRKLK